MAMKSPAKKPQPRRWHSKPSRANQQPQQINTQKIHQLGQATNTKSILDYATGTGTSSTPALTTPALTTPVPTLTFVHYADVTEIYVSGEYYGARERIVAEESLDLARRLQVIGAARVVQIEHRDLKKY